MAKTVKDSPLSTSPTKPALPPGPRGHWLMGSYPDFNSNPVQFLLDLRRDYGDVVHTRFFLWNSYVISHPDDIKHVLQDNNRNYSKQFSEYQKLGWIVGNGLLTSDGDFWLRQRRLIQPAFHRQKIQSFGQLMTRNTVEMLSHWDTAAAEGRPLDISKEMMRLTLRIVGEALFSFDTDAEAQKVDDAFSLANEYVAVDANSPFIMLLRKLPTRRNRQFKQAIATLDEVVNRIIAGRRRQPARQENGDLLSMMMLARDEETGEGMTDEQLRDEVMTLLLAGHETTANALTWTFYLLSTHPQVTCKLHEEIDRVLNGRLPTAADGGNLPYTRMVIDEAMRLYPPAYSIGRVAIEEDKLGGYRIPAGSPVFMSSYVVHRHPDFWENPEGFDPQRFHPQQAPERPRFAYFPFGGGPRLCIGNNFALMEAQLVLATIAQRYQLHLFPGHRVQLQPLITLRPRHGMVMTLKKRPSISTAS